MLNTSLAAIKCGIIRLEVGEGGRLWTFVVVGIRRTEKTLSSERYGVEKAEVMLYYAKNVLVKHHTKFNVS